MGEFPDCIYLFLNKAMLTKDLHFSCRSNLLGKILRVDVDHITVKDYKIQYYTIPDNNPRKTGWRPEIYALGVRNMWRCSLDKGDPKTGILFLINIHRCDCWNLDASWTKFYRPPIGWWLRGRLYDLCIYRRPILPVGYFFSEASPAVPIKTKFHPFIGGASIYWWAKVYLNG